MRSVLSRTRLGAGGGGGGKGNTLRLFVKARSHCGICNWDLFLLTIGYTGAVEVVAVALYQRFHRVPYIHSLR